MGLFGQTKPKDPRETIREMKRRMRSEQRGIDRNINHIKREELKVSPLLKFNKYLCIFICHHCIEIMCWGTKAIAITLTTILLNLSLVNVLPFRPTSM